MKLNKPNGYVMHLEYLEKICMCRTVPEIRGSSFQRHIAFVFSMMPADTLILKSCLLIIVSKHWRKLSWDVFKQAPREARSRTSSQTVQELFSSNLRQQNHHVTQGSSQSSPMSHKLQMSTVWKTSFLIKSPAANARNVMQTEQVTLHASELTMPIFLRVCARYLHI